MLACKLVLTKIWRCFWLSFFVFVVYFAMALTYLLYRRFEAMPTRITIENQFEPAADLPLPAITLCSPNQLTSSAVRHLDDTLVNGNRSGLEMSAALQQVLGFYYFVDSADGDLQVLQDLIQLNRYTVPEVMALLPQSCDAFLQVCIFRQRLYPHCRGLFKPILTKHGLCCIFNSGYHYKTNKRNERDHTFRPRLVGMAAGLQQGLTVIMDYAPHDAATRSIHFAGSTRVMLTDWTEFPSDDESVLVPPFTESFHSTHATATYCSEDVKELPASSRKCSFETEVHLPFFRRYRNSDCDLLCLVRAVESRCRCLMFYVPRVPSAGVCPLTAMPCIVDTKLNLNEWLSKEQCACPRDCDARAYRSDVSIGNLDALPHLLVPLLGVHVNKSTSVMHFFFHKSVYEIQKQETVMSYTTLASNLGGVFGLCMGVSVISVLEILYYCYASARNCVRGRRRRSQRRRRAASLYPSYYD